MPSCGPISPHRGFASDTRYRVSTLAMRQYGKNATHSHKAVMDSIFKITPAVHTPLHCLVLRQPRTPMTMPPSPKRVPATARINVTSASSSLPVFADHRAMQTATRQQARTESATEPHASQTALCRLFNSFGFIVDPLMLPTRRVEADAVQQLWHDRRKRSLSQVEFKRRRRALECGVLKGENEVTKHLEALGSAITDAVQPLQRPHPG